MKNIYTEKEYWKVYKEIKEILLDNKYKEKYPLAILTGGQPGSGKSELSKYIQKQDGNIINIDGDYIREFHPHLKELKQKYGADYPKITQSFVNRTVEQLIDELSEKKYNLIIEGTLRDINVPLRTASILGSRDYLVDLYIIATNKDLSWQSTIDRGDEMKRDGKIPRYVDKEHHDRVVTSLPETAEKLSKSDLFYNVVIMRRNQIIIYNREETPELSPKEILEKELVGNQVRSVDEMLKEREKVSDNKRSLDEQIKEAALELKNDVLKRTFDIDHDMER